MDQIKSLLNKQKKPAGAAPGAEKDDYGDKGLAMVQKKMGMKSDKATNEKITDGARGLYEKFTGKKVNPKYSN